MKISEVILNKDNPLKETTSSGAVATSMGNGNGFVNGGPGTLSRAIPKRKTKKRTK